MKFGFVFLEIFLFLSCQSSKDVVVQRVEGASQDHEYLPVFEKWHKRAYYSKSIEHSVYIESVYFSKDFMTAYRKRFQNIFGQKETQWIAGNDEHIVFFVSVYCNDEPLMKLEDWKIWSIEIQFEDKFVAAKEITKVEQNISVTAFFPFINRWTHEYILLFPKTEELMKYIQTNGKFRLSFDSAEIDMNMDWSYQ